MEKFIINKIKVAKPFLFFSIAATLVFVGGIIVWHEIFVQDNNPIVLLLGIGVIFFLWIIYGLLYSKIGKCVRCFGKDLLYDLAKDIPSNSVIPGSRIHLGKRALFCRSPYIIIPYEEIVYIYGNLTQNAYGGNLGVSIDVYTKGGTFSLNGSCEVFEIEFVQLYNRVVDNPDFIEGEWEDVMHELKHRYPAIIKDENAAHEKRGIIPKLYFASVSSLLGAGGTLMSFIEGPLDITVVFYIAFFYFGVKCVINTIKSLIELKKNE